MLFHSSVNSRYILLTEAGIASLLFQMLPSHIPLLLLCGNTNDLLKIMTDIYLGGMYLTSLDIIQG
jgi:hypothetical protein